jgi:hypothetical protein
MQMLVSDEPRSVNLIIMAPKPALKPKKYVTDRQGQKIGVVLSIEDYKKILADIEELESIRAYDAAKASGDEAIPFHTAMQEIERSRK